MAIIPETKSWTWVIERPCTECGFDAASLAPADFAGAIRANATGWPAVLLHGDVRVRPNDHTWSPLEYAAHVRDVLKLYRERLALMLAYDNPEFPNWDQDETAVAERYGEQDPAVVGAELAEAAAALAADFDTVSGDQWLRGGRRSDGASFTVATFAVYMLHDIVHHLQDVGGMASEA